MDGERYVPPPFTTHYFHKEITLFTSLYGKNYRIPTAGRYNSKEFNEPDETALMQLLFR